VVFAGAVARCTRCAPIIDYGFTERTTTYGVIGVKTWIYRGDIYEAEARQTPPVGTSVFKTVVSEQWSVNSGKVVSEQ